MVATLHPFLKALALCLAAASLTAGQTVEVEISPARRSVAEGRSVGFECGFRLPPGHTLLNAIWQHSKTGTTLPPGRHQKSRDGVLVIERVTEADSGMYTCAVMTAGPNNARGRGWGHASLTVIPDPNRAQVAPTLNVLPEGWNKLIRISTGRSIELVSQVTGHPPPFVTWKRASGKPLPRNRHRLAGGRLSITNFEIPEDVDEYICTTTNTAGARSESRYLFSGWASWGEWGMCSVSCGRGTQERSRSCHIPSLPQNVRQSACPGVDSSNQGTEQRGCNPGTCPPNPYMTVSPSRTHSLMTVTPGYSVELLAEASGNPQPSVIWRRQSGQALPSGSSAWNGRLTIPSFRSPDDVDEYIATATNSAGSMSVSRFVASGWAPWTDWGRCTQSCNRGQQRRSRTCRIPSRLSEAAKQQICPGADGRNEGHETRSCNVRSCPVPTTAPRPTTRPRPRPQPTTRPPPPPTTQPRTTAPPPTVGIVPVTTTPSPPPQMAPGSGLVYRGCFRDHVARRVLRFHYRNFWRHVRRMTPKLCVDHCKRYGHHFAGVERHAECWCGMMNTDTAARSTGCTAPCGGNPGLACGGRNALSVYEVPRHNTQPCQMTRWSDWSRIPLACGWAVQSRTRYLRDPTLFCSTVPRKRMERLIKQRPCPWERVPNPASCLRVARTGKLRYGLGSNLSCVSDREETLYYCMGSCPDGRQCTARRTRSKIIPFTCGGRSKVTIRVAVIEICQCR